jgi:hypothetical protein
LGNRDAAELPPLVEETAAFRVKRGMLYLSALNELRNKHVQYINRVGSWNTMNARMVVRCLDLLLQTTHNILCPAETVEDSDYEELRRAVDESDEGYYTDGAAEEDSQVFWGPGVGVCESVHDLSGSTLEQNVYSQLHF